LVSKKIGTLKLKDIPVRMFNIHAMVTNEVGNIWEKGILRKGFLKMMSDT